MYEHCMGPLDFNRSGSYFPSSLEVVAVRSVAGSKLSDALKNLLRLAVTETNTGD